MKHNSIWCNETFCFRLSLICIAIWFLCSLSISLITYFAWIHQIKPFHEFAFEFSTWFFLLPAIAIFTIVNAMPTIHAWLTEVVPQTAEVKQHHRTKSSAPIVHESYLTVAEKLNMDSEVG
jgi:hypothetical protein